MGEEGGVVGRRSYAKVEEAEVADAGVWVDFPGFLSLWVDGEFNM